MTTISLSRAAERTKVRPLRESDLDTADEVFRSAFNTFVGVPDLFGDADYVRTRFRAAPEAALAAELDGELVGSNFLTRWGTFGFFGPLTVRPDLWDQSIARSLLERTVDMLETWWVTDAGLFTFSHSPKHIALYGSYGFWPQSLTFVAAAPVQSPAVTVDYDLFSTVEDKRGMLRRATEVCDSLLEGLDVGREITAVDEQRLGDTVLISDDDLAGFAVCHAGAGSEAGSGACYVKFGAVRAGSGAPVAFERLIDACFSYAASRGARVLIAGSNAARVGACQALLRRGFRTQLQGVAMQRGNRVGFNRPDVYSIDDWR